jgi:hydroxyacylglutathione hydrolase
MKKVLIIVGGVLLVLVLIIAGLFWSIFGGMQSQKAGLDGLGVGSQPVYDGFSTVYMLDTGGNNFALIDAGNDTNGKPILDALQKRGATPDNVLAIFVTHAHPDHDAGIHLFPKAAIYGLKREVPIAEGKEEFGSMLSAVTGKTNPHPFEITHPLDDGEKVTVGDLEVTAFSVPGHTQGSAAYLARGVLYLGDAAMISSSGQIVGPTKAFSTDVNEGMASLKHLAQELQPRSEEVKVLATGHAGGLTGFAPLAAVK